MVLREQKKFEEALQYARKGAELDPGSGAAQSNLGNVYMDLQRYKEAVVCFRRAMEFQPSFATRSEEHTSELQSLMRISYAVFCLKKKKARKTLLRERSIMSTRR